MPSRKVELKALGQGSVFHRYGFTMVKGRDRDQSVINFIEALLSLHGKRNHRPHLFQYPGEGFRIDFVHQGLLLVSLLHRADLDKSSQTERLPVEEGAAVFFLQLCHLFPGKGRFARGADEQIAPVKGIPAPHFNGLQATHDLKCKRLLNTYRLHWPSPAILTCLGPLAYRDPTRSCLRRLTLEVKWDHGVRRIFSFVGCTRLTKKPQPVMNRLGRVVPERIFFLGFGGHDKEQGNAKNPHHLQKY